MITVTIKCVGCNKKRDITPGEIPPGEQPMCNDCYMPMVAIRAKS